jgi:hypothetical protein
MSKLRFALLLRLLSYGAWFTTFGWAVFENSRPAGPPCQNMGCIGTGIGEAILLLFGLLVGLFLSALLNIVSFVLQGSPRSVYRKVELWLLFVFPLSLLMAVALRFFL